MMTCAGLHMQHRDALPSVAVRHVLFEVGRRDGFSSSVRSTVGAACQRHAAVSIPYTSELTATFRGRHPRLSTLVAGCRWSDVEFPCRRVNVLPSWTPCQHEYLWAPQLAAVFAHSAARRQTRRGGVSSAVGAMKCTLTGDAGFIGSHIVDALAAEGCAATGLDNLSSGKRGNMGARVTLTMGDVRDAHAVATALPLGTDTVFHLDAQIDVRRAVEDPATDMQVSVEGTINVLQR